MTTKWAQGLLALVGLACVDRTAPTSEFAPTAQEICVDYCEFAEICWHEEVLANPFPTVGECIAECQSLDAAWADDPLERYQCAELINEMRLCALSYEHCEAFDDAQIDGRWGPNARCVDEVEAVFRGQCDIPDPRDPGIGPSP
jgi:hypothetical protein